MNSCSPNLALLFFAASISLGAANMHVDFESGAPPSSQLQITALTPTTNIDYSSGRLNVTTADLLDGIGLFFPELQPMCFVFSGLELSGFDLDEGLDFVISNGPNAEESITYSVVQSNSVRVKIIEDRQPGTTVLFNDILIGNLADVTEVRVDWLSRDDVEYVQGHIKMRTGTVHTQKVVSTLSHSWPIITAPHVKVRGVLRVQKDPFFSFDSMSFDEAHVPEPSTYVLVGSTVLALAIRRRRR
jgi:hypothetical protein